LWLAQSHSNPEELALLRGSATVYFKRPRTIHVLVISARVRQFCACWSPKKTQMES